MKKTPSKKLQLRRENLRTLTAAEAEQAAGAWTGKYSWFVTLCPSCGPACPGPITGN
jgi:hypothetical protein